MTESATQFCVACGFDLNPGATFCTDCGHEIGTPPAAEPMPIYQPNTMGIGCNTCGGDGSYLDPELIYCPVCRWLRPLGNDFYVDLDAFVWQMDAQAMEILNNLGPVAGAAHNIAERYGRPVFEAATNGIRLSERQMPDIFDMAVRAARLLSLTHLPEVYVSGERMWDVYSLGGYGGSFVSIGSVLINFKPKDLLFLIAREMGHVRAGHVYWSTAMQFLMGQSRSQGTILGEGVMQFLNPTKIIESAVEAPLMRWARHSQITADRAATLVTGDLDCARRVLTQWAMKSFPVAGKINLEAWLEQEAAADDPYLQLSEWTMSTEPYLAPRLKILSEYHSSEGFEQWHNYIDHWYTDAGLADDPEAPKKGKKPPPDTERLTCSACGEAMRVPSKVLDTDKPVNIRCPNKDCRKVLRVKPKAPPAKPEKPPAKPNQTKDELRAEKAKAKAKLTCVSCQQPMYINRSELEGDAPINVRCPNKECGEILSIKPRGSTPDDKTKKDNKPERPDLTSD